MSLIVMSFQKQEFIDLKNTKFGTGLHLFIFYSKNPEISEAKLLNRSIITQIIKMVKFSLYSVQDF